MASLPYPSLKRNNSLLRLPPDMSELRVVLLGNSWIQRSFVGNLLLNEITFDAKKEPAKPVRQSGDLQGKKISVINSPDLLQPNLTADRLTELVTEIAEASAPGPHVFVLVLQPEDFTEQQSKKLQSVLKRFGEQAFDHSLLLISTPREKSPGYMEKYMDAPHLRDMISKCRYQDLWMNITEFDQNLNYKGKTLLMRINRMVSKYNGKPLLYDLYEEPESSLSPTEKKQLSRIAAVTKKGITAAKDFTIMLFGKSDDKKSKLTNFITGAHIGDKSSVASGEWRRNRLTVVKTPDLLSLSVETVREEIKKYVSLCSPGPNVLLLLVKPSDFTESDREKLKFILNHFGPDAFKHSMVILTHNEIYENRSIDDLIGDCEGRYYSMPKQDLIQLMEKIVKLIVHKNESFLTFTDKKKQSLNLVLCGRTKAGKTSVAQSILGQTESQSPEQCVKHQREVCGRRVSLVELPALSGKPPETVIQQCLHCISLCGPEGVHTFLLVVPVGPLTDEDKTELMIIQDSLSPRALLFSMIVFTVESDPTAPAVVNFVKGHRDLQKLYERCGGGYFIFNTRDQQQVSELLDYTEASSAKNEPNGFTTETLVNALHQEIHDLKSMSTARSNDNLSSDSLRIVLIGKTGCGKSSSGNIILGDKMFSVKLSRHSVTKVCKKVSAKVEGRGVVVVDTPGLFDTNLSHEDINKEMVKCISLLAPGPHVFLLVIKIDRFTSEDREAIRLIKEGFGKDADQFILILFTHGDVLEKHNMTIEEYMEEGDYDAFNQLLTDCGNRYHVFNNWIEDRSQVQELLQKIDDMVKENGEKYYTNDILQEAEAAINKETEKLLQEKDKQIKKERARMDRKHKQAMEELKQTMEKQKKEFEMEKLQREQQLREKIEEDEEQQRREQEKREEEDTKRKGQDEEKRQEWKQKYKDLEEKIRSKEMSNELTASQLQESRRQMEQWEKEKKEWWEQRQLEDEARRQAEQQKQKQYEQEREELNKRLEQERLWREEEEKKMIAFEEDYQTKLERMEKEKEKYKEEARARAEEFNDFQKKLNSEFEDRKQEYERSMKDKDEKYDLLKALADHNEKQKIEAHQKEINDIVKSVAKNPGNVKKIHRLLKKYEKQMKNIVYEEDRIPFLDAQEQELKDLIQNLLKEKDTSGCVIL